jgi:hypothetical protein
MSLKLFLGIVITLSFLFTQETYSEPLKKEVVSVRIENTTQDTIVFQSEFWEIKFLEPPGSLLGFPEKTHSLNWICLNIAEQMTSRTHFYCCYRFPEDSVEIAFIAPGKSFYLSIPVSKEFASPNSISSSIPFITLEKFREFSPEITPQEYSCQDTIDLTTVKQSKASSINLYRNSNIPCISKMKFDSDKVILDDRLFLYTKKATKP